MPPYKSIAVGLGKKALPSKKGVAYGTVGMLAAGAAVKSANKGPAQSNSTAVNEHQKGTTAVGVSRKAGTAGMIAGTTAYAAKKGVLGKTVGKAIGHTRPGKALFAVSTGAALVAGHHVLKQDRAQGSSRARAGAHAGLTAAGFSEPSALKPARATNKGRAVTKGRAPSKSPSF
jgi:hypothetical protein